MTAQPYVAACSSESYDTLSRWSSWNCTVNCHFPLVRGCMPRKSDDSTWNLTVDLLGSGATTGNRAPVSLYSVLLKKRIFPSEKELTAMLQERGPVTCKYR